MFMLGLCSAIVDVILALIRSGLCTDIRGIVEPCLHLQTLQIITDDLDDDVLEEADSVEIYVGRKSDEADS